MVEQTYDRREFPIQYAGFRKDKEAEPGYSRELVSDLLKPEFYDDLDNAPWPSDCGECRTFMDFFKRNLSETPEAPFFGTRASTIENGKTVFAEYEWLSYQDVDKIVTNLAKGMQTLDLCPEIDAEDTQWRFIGIWSKNRYEWTSTLLAATHYNIATVGFYEAQGKQQIDYILNQTRLSTVVCAAQQTEKLVDIVAEGLAQSIKNVVTLDTISAEVRAKGESAGLKFYSFGEVLEAGAKAKDVAPFRKTDKNDVYILSYTSGTTGDAKGVKISYNMILRNVNSSNSPERFVLAPHASLISYLPLTHSFEQSMLALALMQRCKVGFYQGDPLKLVEDCQLLKPDFFPSVPRLFNRIYGKLKSRFDEATGCKKWLVDQGLASKIHHYENGGYVGHKFWDSLVFGKAAALLGGNVKQMVTGSAPIDAAVLSFLKICFSCPITEGYGLTETAGGNFITQLADNTCGHVGGPIESVACRLKDLPEMEYLSSDKPYPRGEVCLRGPAIFPGYFMRPDKTKEAFEGEWFKTGDVAAVLPNGAIKIIDRSKNIFKLSQGEYIAPEKIENIFVLSPFVAQSMVCGDSKKTCTVAIVIPDKDAAKAWFQQKGKNFDAETFCKDADFKKEVFANIITLANENHLSSLEKPKDIFLHDQEFSVDNNILTPTFKLKRNVGAQVFAKEIADMYAVIEEAEAKRNANRS